MGNPMTINEAGIKALLEANGYEVPDHILTLSGDQHMALTVVMANCLTNGALEALGLSQFTMELIGNYNGPWEYEEGKLKRLTLVDYHITPNVPFHRPTY